MTERQLSLQHAKPKSCSLQELPTIYARIKRSVSTKYLLYSPYSYLDLFLITITITGDEVANIVTRRYGSIDYEYGIKNASTDFVSLSIVVVSESIVRYADVVRFREM